MFQAQALRREVNYYPQNMKTEVYICLKFVQDKWIGLLHHICNQHQWLGGQCDHDENFDHDEALPWFDHRDKDFIELQKVILNPKLLGSLKYYTRFR